MKFTFKLSVALLCLSSNFLPVAGQTPTDGKYLRSSLSMVMIESDNFPNKDAVVKSWNSYPFPDKYNKHDIDLKSIDISKIVLKDSELLKAGYLKDTLKTQGDIAKALASLKPLKYLNAEKTIAVVLPGEAEEFTLKINQVLAEKKVAHQLVAKWFNRGKDGKYNMDLIAQRGYYNATELEAALAKGSHQGSATLGNAGQLLINNTFVTFTKLEFYENEPVARLARDLSKIETIKAMEGKPQVFIDNALKAIDKTYEESKDGYSLWTKTWLYKLVWNDSIQAVFYNTFDNPEKFYTENQFTMELVGTQYNQSLVVFDLNGTRTQEKIIDLALVRNMDNAFSKLQKKYDVFKVKTPILSVNPVMAQIGMKEGLEGGETFDVLELTVNPKTQRTEYVKVGSVTADKTVIWDNRYNAGEPVTPVLDKNGNPIKATQFKGGGKKIQPGMLLKQAK